MNSPSEQFAQLTQLKEWLTHVTYKPGWKITAYATEFELTWIAIEMTLEDSYHPGDVMSLSIRSPVYEFMDVEDFKRWLAWRLARIESHEMREWLKWDNVVMFDPHSDDANLPKNT